MMGAPAAGAVRAEESDVTGRLHGVAMDGPSGIGESTVSPRLALACDSASWTRGMYRAAALAVLRAGVAPEAPRREPR
jgi:cytidylate kinase